MKKKKKNAPKDKGRHTCRADVSQNQFSMFQVLDQCVSHFWLWTGIFISAFEEYLYTYPTDRCLRLLIITWAFKNCVKKCPSLDDLFDKLGARQMTQITQMITFFDNDDSGYLWAGLLICFQNSCVSSRSSIQMVYFIHLGHQVLRTFSRTYSWKHSA